MSLCFILLAKKNYQELMKEDIKWHDPCRCKYWLDASNCDNKQHWKDDKCWCECKELIDKGV